MTDTPNFAARITALEKAITLEFENLLVGDLRKDAPSHVLRVLSEAWEKLNIACAVARDYASREAG